MMRDRPEPHGDFVELLKWLDGELPPEWGAALRTHIGACPSCMALLDSVRAASDTVAGALATLDVLPPKVDAVALRSAARQRLLRAVAAAVVLVLLLAGGVYALVPGSDLRAWLAARLHGSEATPADASPSPPLALFSVVAPDSVDVLVDGPLDSLVIRVVRSAGLRLSVRGPETGAPVNVELGEGRLRLTPDSARLLTLIVPRGTRARIRSRGHTVLDLPAESISDAPVAGDSVLVLRLYQEGRGSDG